MDHAERTAQLPWIKQMSDPGDIAISSTSIRDQGIDPIMHVDLRTSAIRQQLGDICFVERRDTDGKLLDLFVVPEWPEDVPLDEERALHFYAVLLTGPRSGRLFVLRPWLPGSGYKKLSWDAGMRLVRKLRTADLPKDGQGIVDRLFEIDEMSRHNRFNADKAELRRQVGPRRGGRLYLNHLRFPGSSGFS